MHMTFKKTTLHSLLFFATSTLLPHHLAADAPLRQFGSSSKALSLIATGENYLKSDSPADLQKAIEIFERAISDLSFKRLDYETQIPIFLTLASAYQKNAQYIQEEKLLTSLISTPDLKPFVVRLRLALINSYTIQNRIEEAEVHLKKLTKIHPKTLPQEERAEIAALIYRLEHLYKELLDSAEMAFEKKEYPEAISSYSKILHAITKTRFPKSSSKKMRGFYLAKVQYRLGLLYLLSGNTPTAISHLQAQDKVFLENSPELTSLLQQNSYCLAIALKKEGASAQALTAFNDYLTLNREKPLSHFYEAHLYAASSAYALKLYKEAIVHLEELHEANRALSTQGKLLRAKIAKDSSQEEESLTYLNDLIKSISTPKKVYLEALYLKGTILLNQGRLEEAVQCIERSIPQNPSLHSWSYDALYHLGNTYLNIAPEALSELQMGYLERSETCILRLLELKKNPDAYLLLAKNIFLRITHFAEEIERERLEAILQEPLPQETRFEVALLIAQTEKKKNRFQHLQTAEFENCPSFGKAYYLQAIDEIADFDFQSAQSSLQKAADFAKDDTLRLAIAKAYIAVAKEKALPILDTLTETLQEEIDCLRIQASEKNASREKAHIFLSTYADSPYTPDVLLQLAAISFQEKEYAASYQILLNILKSYPSFHDRAAALHMAAATLDQMQAEFEQARILRKELLKLYPTSSYAEDAAFRLFPEKEYLLGTPHAISHLKTMVQEYPDSPYIVAARVYIGSYLLTESIKQKELDLKNSTLRQALQEFRATETAYANFSSKKAIPAPLTLYLKEMEIEAMLYQGKTLLDIFTLGGEKTVLLEEAEEVFKAVIHRLNSFITKLLSINEKACTARMYYAYQEASFLLAKVFEGQGKEGAARKQLLLLIEWMDALKLKGEFLTKATLELAVKEQKLELFDQAEQTASASTSALLEVWIAKSVYLIKMNELDKAMMLLSKVVNADSASQLRIKAMVLRADIYELQHRQDLAIKQLEAAAKKGGEWGLEAEKKLGVLQFPH